jgi:hypothetical protein
MISVISFYMSNISQEVLDAQRDVVKLFLPSGCEFRQILTDRQHGEALDEYVENSDAAIIVFLDVDCVPIHPSALTYLIEHAKSGELVGAIQRSNHIENGGHTFVAPCAMAFKRSLWEQAGKPSFKPTTRGDVAEEFTYACEAAGLQINEIPITYSEDDRWALEGDIRYGYGTEYGGMFYHHFEIRAPINQQRFVARCKDILRRENPIIAVVTPYCTEATAMRRRCIDSVKAQTLPVRHYLVHDGMLSASEVDVYRHISLGQQHWNYGNTPRAIGAMLAIAEDADAIAFLDADNTYDPDHIETCWNLVKYNSHLAWVAAKRRIALPDGTILQDAEASSHVDTSCFFFLPGSYFTIPQWALQPRPLTPICDRFFYALIRRLNLPFLETDKPTVTFNSTYEAHYRAARQVPPSDAKPSVDLKTASGWWHERTHEQKQDVRRMLGLGDFDIR